MDSFHFCFSDFRKKTWYSFWLQGKKFFHACVGLEMKRPSAVKVEQQTPKVRRTKPAEASEPEEAEPPKPAESPKGEQGSASVKPVEAPVPEKSKPAKASEGTGDKLPPVSKKAWGDVKYQCQSLARKGKDYLLNAWQEAQGQGHQGKREFCYHIFLLDPNICKKEVHKESLQRHSTTNTTVKGWMTKWQIGKLEGFTPCLENFESLCDSAVEGMPARRHENEGLAKQGVMQYYCEKEMAQEEKEQNESLTKAKQAVEIDDQEIFQQVEDKLQVKPVTKQLTLGGGKPENSAESKAKKLQSQYDECLDKCKKLNGDFQKNLEKLEELLKVFEKENATKPSAAGAAMHAELQSLKESLDGKDESFVNRVQTYPEKAADPVGQDDLKKLEDLKKELDAQVKSLKKAMTPHKVWAEHKGLLKRPEKSK